MNVDRSPRPITFLVSTRGGQAAEDVFGSLTPAIERLGAWQRVKQPESSLAYRAAEVEAAGSRAIHLAIGLVQDCYLTPAVPTILLPLWDYPDIPAEDLQCNGRMNWARVASRADLILAPSHFTAEAFRKAGVETPIAVIPPPPRAGWSDLPTWGHGLPITVTVPHLILGELEVDETLTVEPLAITGERPAASWSSRVVMMGRRPLRRLKPYLSNATIHKIDGYRHRVAPMLRRPNPVFLFGTIARAGYRRFVGGWISDEAHRKLKGLKNRLTGRRPLPTTPPADRPLDPLPLTLSGLVYSINIDESDPTIDDADLMSAAIHAFHDRPDITLLIRLVTTPLREVLDLERLAQVCTRPQIEYRCRIVVVTGEIDDADRLELGRATSYAVEAGRSRGWSLFLAESLASGRPAIAPRHSMLGERVNESVGFPLLSHPEPTAWPNDARAKHATTWNRVVWSDLRDRLVESARIAEHDPRRYEAMSASARRELAEGSAVEDVADSLRSALGRINDRPAGAFSWS